MKLYHIDRAESISDPGLLRSEFPISKHGSYYWKDKPLSNFCLVRDAITEHLFESVRYREFSYMPSRFSSFFACDKQYFEFWWKTLVTQDFPNPKVWEVEADQAICLDASMLQSFWCRDNEWYFSPSQAENYARAYWSRTSEEFLRGSQSHRNNQAEHVPQYEYLLPLPVRVLRQLSVEEVAALRCPQTLPFSS